MIYKNNSKGFLLVLILVFGAIFFMMMTSFITYVISQKQLQDARYQGERALDIAEGGLNYYRWYLAHFPDNTTNGTTTPSPYVHTYYDPEGAAIGEFSLEISSSTACGSVQSIDIYSTGHTYESPNIKREVYGRYAQPTVAEYAYIIGSNVWAGSDRTIVGPYHSNGVVRMDGTNNSTVSSGQEDWVCDGSLPCTPAANGTTLDAVYGAGPNSSLWSFPTPPISFNSMTLDLADMQVKAQQPTNGGVYIPPSGNYGYRINFQNDGTFDVYNVDLTWSHNEYSTEDGWFTARNLIRDDDFVATYTIPSVCPIIFVEDKVWLEGEVDGKVTIAAADVDSTLINPSIILHDNITYVTATSGLLAIAEDDILLGYDVPDNMEINGIFVAKVGKFGRNHYTVSTNGGDRCRNSLTVNGTIVSYGREGSKWTGSGCGSYGSGFGTRYNSYDRNLVANPPPLTPEVSDTYEFIEWREVE